MRRILTAVVACGLLMMAGQVRGGDVVAVPTVTWTNFRGQALGEISSEQYWQGTTLVGTNVLLYAGTDTNGAIQGLNGVTIDVAVGSSSSNTHYVGTIISTNEGTFWFSATVPSNMNIAYAQVKITDENTNIYIYPWMYFSTKVSL